MEQLVLELAAAEPPSFENFLTGPNAEVIAALRRFAGGAAGETGLVLWGGPGAGKTHLLHAAACCARECGSAATLFAHPEDLAAANLEALGGEGLVLVDDIDRAPPAVQAQLFTLFNRLQAAGGHLLVASRVPVGALPLREDLRTRLGWGLVYEVALLPDASKPAALIDYARRRGFALSEDVVSYLLAHGRRDMSSLMATLAALDRHSLAAKRTITVPLLRDWLQREIGLKAALGPGFETKPDRRLRD